MPKREDGQDSIRPDSQRFPHHTARPLMVIVVVGAPAASAMLHGVRARLSLRADHHWVDAAVAVPTLRVLTEGPRQVMRGRGG